MSPKPPSQIVATVEPQDFELTRAGRRFYTPSVVFADANVTLE